MKKLFFTLFFLLVVLHNASAWGWAVRDVIRQPDENPNYKLGDHISFAWDVNATGWGATLKKAGIGTTNTSAGLDWQNIIWVDDAGDGFGNNEGVCSATYTVNSVGTWYYSLWLGWGTSVGDNGRWYNGSSTWTEGLGTFQSSSFIVSALDNPSTQTSTSISSSQIDLSWAKDTQNHNVMIVRKKSTESWTEPTQGTAYAFNATIGSGVVVYNSNGTSYSNTGLTSSTGYDYKFYSENNSYYSAGVTASATTATATSDYFRSKATGNWGDASSWQSSYDNVYWIATATLAPNSSANTVSILNGHTISVNGAETANGLTINSGGVLQILSTKSLTVSGTLTNSAGTPGLVVKSGGSLIQNSAVSATVERDITGWADAAHGWHFLSSPVTAQAISSGFTASPSTNYDFYAWWEPTNVWVNYKNTSVAPTWATANILGATSGGDNFIPGKGYLVSYATAAAGTKQFFRNTK